LKKRISVTPTNLIEEVPLEGLEFTKSYTISISFIANMRAKFGIGTTRISII